MTLSFLKQVLVEVKCCCPAWFGLLHPHSLLDSKGVLVELRGGDSTKVPHTDPLHWELICSGFSDAFEQQGGTPERAINTRLTCCQILCHLLRGIEYYLWKFLRSENSWMTTSTRARSGPAPLLIVTPFFLLGKMMET